MGYGTTFLGILAGISIMFFLYSESFTGPEAAQYAAPYNSVLGGSSSEGVSATNTIISAITGAILLAAGAGIVSGLTGGGFASIYLIPAAAIGGVLGATNALTTLDAIFQAISGMPLEVKAIFAMIMIPLVVVIVISFVKGDW